MIAVLKLARSVLRLLMSCFWRVAALEASLTTAISNLEAGQ